MNKSFIDNDNLEPIVMKTKKVNIGDHIRKVNNLIKVLDHNINESNKIVNFAYKMRNTLKDLNDD